MKLRTLGIVFALTIVGSTLLFTRTGNTNITTKPVIKEIAPKVEQRQLKASTAAKATPDINSGTKIFLTSQVNPESADQVISAIRTSNKKHPGKAIYLLLDSPGGSVMDGARIITAMQASEAPVNTVCLQLCASMAATIEEYGVARYAVARSILMFHPASIGMIVQGELDKAATRLNFLQEFVNKMVYYTAVRSGQSYETMKAKESVELWLDADDSLDGNLIDGVVAVDLGEANPVDYTKNQMRSKIDMTWESPIEDIRTALGIVGK